MSGYRHPTAVVDEGASIGDDVKLWHDVHVREAAIVGSGVSIGKGAYIDTGAIVGRGSKIQNYACIYKGVVLAPYVFVGPHATFTNDLNPRAFGDWALVPTRVDEHASIGANATIVCGVHIGAYAMVGAGAVVTKDVPPHAEVVGNPARQIGYVCFCGTRLVFANGHREPFMDMTGPGYCRKCQKNLEGIRWGRLEQ